MKKFNIVLTFITMSFLPRLVMAQTNKDIQGTWQMVSTVITTKTGKSNMDSSNQYLIKTITANRIMFSVFDKKTNNLLATGVGTASCDSNKYTETFEYVTSDALKKQPMIFNYKVEANILTYEGGVENFHIVEVLKRIE